MPQLYLVSVLLSIMTDSGLLTFPTTPHLLLSPRGSASGGTRRLAAVRLSGS